MCKQISREIMATKRRRTKSNHDHNIISLFIDSVCISITCTIVMCPHLALSRILATKGFLLHNIFVYLYQPSLGKFHSYNKAMSMESFTCYAHRSAPQYLNVVLHDSDIFHTFIKGEVPLQTNTHTHTYMYIWQLLTVGRTRRTLINVVQLNIASRDHLRKTNALLSRKERLCGLLHFLAQHWSSA